jgi:hypothetical protein
MTIPATIPEQNGYNFLTLPNPSNDARGTRVYVSVNGLMNAARMHSGFGYAVGNEYEWAAQLGKKMACHRFKVQLTGQY